MTDTIFALSSGHGRAGVAVVRITGPGAGPALEALAGSRPSPRRAVLRTLRCPRTGDALDRALVLWFPAPTSFSGEDMGELHVHGGRAVLEGVVGALGAIEGLRPAAAGEFTRRAFENGKLDLTEVEGLADLINADTEAQRRQALAQAQGGFRTLAENWRAELIEVMALVESALDFSDEGDVPGEVACETRPLVEGLAAAIASHLADSHRGERLRDGYRILLAGPPNVGKSSLLNALARRDAAIVSEEAGTTRDVIEVHLDLGGYPVLVMDTAGIRGARGQVEEEGIRRTFARAADADLILWLVDAVDPQWEPPAEFGPHTVLCQPVINKIDLVRPADVPNWDGQTIELSAKTGEGLEALTDHLLRMAAAGFDGVEAAVVTRARHRHELEACRAALERFLAEPMSDLELRAEDLRQAATALGRLAGRVDMEEVLGHIFSEFCIGK